MQCCNQPMTDWSEFTLPINEETFPYFYCPRCHSHFYKETMYSKEDWFIFINNEMYRNHQLRVAKLEQEIAVEESLHSHELINHSNPEEIS